MNNLHSPIPKPAVSGNLVKTLSEVLHKWHFEPYGQQGAVSCYPPHGTGFEAFQELNSIALITSVCGPFYVVTHLR